MLMFQFVHAFETIQLYKQANFKKIIKKFPVKNKKFFFDSYVIETKKAIDVIIFF